MINFMLCEFHQNKERKEKENEKEERQRRRKKETTDGEYPENKKHLSLGKNKINSCSLIGVYPQCGDPPDV